MKTRILMATGVLGLSLALSAPALALNCPASFKDAEAAIAKATAAMSKVSDKGKQGLVHTLIDDAKTMLSSGKHNHEKAATGVYDHARAVAKARAAKGYAEAAEILANASK